MVQDFVHPQYVWDSFGMDVNPTNETWDGSVQDTRPRGHSQPAVRNTEALLSGPVVLNSNDLEFSKLPS